MRIKKAKVLAQLRCRNRARLISASRLLFGFTVIGLLSACKPPANPTLELPPNAGSIWIAPVSIPLANYGYMQDEYFFSGTAESYVNFGPLTSNGRWRIVSTGQEADYKSRMVIYRPIDPADFNGTVIIEWLNVSSGIDTPADWVMAHTELLRRGYAYVGISAQAIGIEGGTTPLPTPLPFCLALKCVNPSRYGALTHPGDSYSYDIFRQAAQAVRHPVGINPLGNLTPQYFIAAGQSQSAHRLVTFINAFGTWNNLFDGYFVHSRLGPVPELGGGGSAPLSEPPLWAVNTPPVVRIRTDLHVPVMNVQTETDLFVLGSYASRQPDSADFRLWEIAGSAHADFYVSTLGLADTGDDITAAQVFITDTPSSFFGACPDNINTAPQNHFVVKAAISALNNWVVNGVPPASIPRLAVNTTEDGFQLDSYGNALGGVRSPYVDVPIATMTGMNSSTINDPDICFLYGSTDLLPDLTLQSLYSTNAAYVADVTSAAATAVADGVLVQEDADLIIQAAAAENIPPP